MFKNKLVELLEETTGQKGIQLEHPTEASHGDYSSNIAMAIFSKSKALISKSKTNPKLKIQNYKTPKELAEAIVKELEKDANLKNVVEKVEVAAPGFINFWLSEKTLLTELERAVKEGEGYGSGEGLGGKKIIIEYTDPNPFKEFHIGHLYSNAVGESIARLLEANGAEVKRVNYQGDVGMHVAKAIWGMRQKEINKGEPLDSWDSKPPSVRVNFLGRAYSFGASGFEKNEIAKAEITKLNEEIYKRSSEIEEYRLGKQWSLEYFQEIYKRLGTTFNRLYFESEAGSVGIGLVKDYLKKGIFEESEGAVIFPGKKFGLHNRVFINSLGLPTYETKELGLAPTKYKDFPYDESIIVTGNEINEYFKVVLEALKQINPELAAKTKHISHGMVRLPGGKISSRLGDVLSGEWLLNEAKKQLQAVHEMQDVIADKVGVGAVKYALLKSSIGTDIIFDLKTSLSLDGDSGPYLQYTYARTQSVLEKAKMEGVGELGDVREVNPEELGILRTFYKFPEVVGEAAQNFAPNSLCNFLYDFATKYNRLYNTHRILEAESRGAKNLRLALTKVTGHILKTGLNLLGIQAPKTM